MDPTIKILITTLNALVRDYTVLANQTKEEIENGLLNATLSHEQLYILWAQFQRRMDTIKLMDALILELSTNV